ncbi:uncharacterized protein [Rutidosis leptorrhynchoides]|uniref:uncharacterized protein isoform X2 n=1 Tax=Rutidosis leptorrhynchoides TaxID=125765 RepID=UPI003A999742
MYGRLEGELRFNRWHMWPVPSSSTPSVAAPESSFVVIDTNSFNKDGRKITVGDCALFKSHNNSLPFVGRIRKLIVGKESSPSLSVNWLYRPADVKLKEGALLDAAPNEIFYSFHRDEIPAASLLHPCKVTFYRKGVELPSGICSFVCRRVYDIEGKCLWWLTDKDYINEQQQEVNQLLGKTRIKMYGTSHTGGCSPKPVNGPNGTAQVKPSSDSVQNSSSSISSHAKNKKREHGVHNSDSVKRERLSRLDDADSGQHRSEHPIKTEISKITDKGGLVDIGGVEKLIQLMRPDNTEKKHDLASRTMLVDVISATERFDCLSRFVQLRGLLVLDEWLQEIHKGKIGDVSPKVNDKSVEEFLFSLLRALDKLPVNLHALQTCNVGKSVNHLRSHKNSEIQNKARSLVSTWKRRVEAEMNIIETKSGTNRGGSWSNKSMMSEVSPTGNRRTGSSCDPGSKSSTLQPLSLKSQQPKHNNSGEAVTESPTSPVSTKLSPNSSQSPNNSQSCSVPHSKNSSNGSHASTISGVQKELGKMSRNLASEKGSPTRNMSERASDVSVVDIGNSPRLIVRLPNAGPSPARTISVDSPEVPSTQKPNQKLRVKSESLERKNVPNTVTDLSQEKDELIGRDEDHGKNGGHEKKMTDATFGSGSSSGVTPKSDKLHEASYSSINALVESCVKFSEASVSPPVGDDVGMNILASVAAGETSKSDVSPVCSPVSNSPLPEDSCSVNVTTLRRIAQDEDNISVANGQSVDSLSTKGGSQQPVLLVGTHISGDSKDASFGCEVKINEENTQADLPIHIKPSINSNVEIPNNDDSASWSSSDMHEDDKKTVHKRSSSCNLTTTSRGDADLPPKSEDAERPADVAAANVAELCTPVEEMSVKLDFDLNEVLPSEDGTQGEVEKSSIPFHSSNSPVMGNQSALITIAAAAKGPFYPSENLLRGKAELGWKGSAATSAFRPAKPRKADVHVPDNRTNKQARPLLDFDLNVGVVDDARENFTPTMRLEGVNTISSGRLNLDLNACEESADVLQLSVSSSGRPSTSHLPGGPNSSRDFDLNDGPGVEEVGGESVSFFKNGLQFMSSVPNVRMNNTDVGNFSNCYPLNNTYPAITIPSYPSQRMLTPGTASTSHNPDIFRGPVLSSSPAVTFSSVPFQYSAFPFDTNFSMPSVPNMFSSVSTAYVDNSSSGGPLFFPSIPSQAQMVGPNGAVSMPYRPYFMSLPGNSSNVGPDDRKWPSHGLDLNAGSAGGGSGTDDKLPSGLKRIPLAGSQALADEQLKMFTQMAAGSGASKRKEPDGGWDGDRLSYRNPSWQ